MRIAALFVMLITAAACDRYKHVLTNVERIDDPEDALRVYHDKARGVTCYEAPSELFNSGGLACVADIQLKR
jgi:hypothetical protein